MISSPTVAPTEHVDACLVIPCCTWGGGCSTGRIAAYGRAPESIRVSSNDRVRRWVWVLVEENTLREYQLSPTKCGVFRRTVKRGLATGDSVTKKETGGKKKKLREEKDHWALRECSSNSGNHRSV